MKWPFVRRRELEQLHSKLDSLKKEISEYQVSSKKQKDEIVRLKKMKANLESKIKELSYPSKKDPSHLTPFRLDNVMIPSIPASYTIFKKGNYYCAQPCKHGLERFLGRDASSVIQSALNALMTGGKIFIKEGTYVISKAITTATSGQIIMGEGRSTIFKLQNGAEYNIFNVKHSHTTFRDLAFDGNKANLVLVPGHDKQNAIYIDNVANNLIDNCYFYDFISHPTQIGGVGAMFNVHQNCVFENNDWFGATPDWGKWNIIFNNVFINGYGLELANARLTTVVGNAFYNITADYAIYVYRGTGNVIAHNIFEEVIEKGAILVLESSDNVIDGNTIKYCSSWHGIYVEGDDNLISNNDIGNCGGIDTHAALSLNGTRNQILNNHLHNSTNGLRIFSGMSGNIIKNNKFRGNTYNPVYLPIPPDNIFEGNIGFVTENSGTASGTSPITIPQTTHLLDVDPTYVNAVSKTSGYYVISVRYDPATKDIIIEHSGGATSIDVYWEAKA